MNTISEPGAYRQPPHNIEAEQELLGAILVNNEAMDRVSNFLDPEHFFEPLHGRIYAEITRLILNGHVATPVTLKALFEQDEAMQEAGGAAYLAGLAGAATSIINVADYGRTLYDHAIRRDLIKVGTDMVNTAYDAPLEQTPREQIEYAEQTLFTLAETGEYQSGFRDFRTSLKEAIKTAAAAYHRDGHLAGISSGLTDLDSYLGGLQNSDLIILAGRPSMGKTALATNIAFNAAKMFEPQEMEDGSIKAAKGARVGFFSLEMSAEQLATRILSEQSEVYSDKIRKGTLDERQFDRLLDASQVLEQVPLYIDDTAALPISSLASRARRLKRQQGLDLIVVDYLQLVRPPAGSGFGDNRVQEISAVTQGLKAIAKELNIPVIALSQLSRQVESRDDKRPQLSDLRESGSIEQDADIVMFVFRDEYYVGRTQPTEGTPEHAEWQEKMDKVHGLAEVILGKNRHGPIGTVKLSFQGEFARFGNLARDAYNDDDDEI
ncbi:MAG: replicative DNA helicase [Alphaproteobacteria bacterium]